MSPIAYRIAISLLALGVWASPAHAITPVGVVAPSGPPAYGYSGTIERGGIVTAVNIETNLLVVDGTPYLFQAPNVTIHGNPPSANSPRQQLRKGTSIRFSTVWDSYRQRHKVVEVWISGGQ